MTSTAGNTPGNPSRGDWSGEPQGGGCSPPRRHPCSPPGELTPIPLQESSPWMAGKQPVAPRAPELVETAAFSAQTRVVWGNKGSDERGSGLALARGCERSSPVSGPFPQPPLAGSQPLMGFIPWEPAGHLPRCSRFPRMGACLDVFGEPGQPQLPSHQFGGAVRRHFPRDVGKWTQPHGKSRGGGQATRGLTGGLSPSWSTACSLGHALARNRGRTGPRRGCSSHRDLCTLE